MNSYIFSLALLYFARLVLGLIAIKVVLITYRIRSGKWPASLVYLIKIVEWEKEALKLLALFLIALAFSYVKVMS